ncbi:MAG: hypothetical protein JXR76_22995 [Deltaproteobacteria bacterium]|nr:hypothetical protein [Deltaproteobacteria bacterium]
MKRVLCITCCLLMSCLPITGASQTNSDEAKRLYEAGAENFSIKNYVEAAALFRQAYSLSPVWKLWFNIGQSEAAAKHYGLALEAFEKYLALGGDEIPALDMENVIREVKLLRELVGKIEVENAPDGAEIHVDETFRSKLPLVSELRVAAGIPHQVDIIYNGNIIHSQPLTVGSAGIVVVRVKGGRERALAMPFSVTDDDFNSASQKKGENPALNLTTRQRPTLIQPLPKAPANLKPLKIFTLTSGILALASGGAAVTFWVLAGKKNDDLTAAANQLKAASAPNESLEAKAYDLREEVDRYDALTTAMVISSAVFTTATAVSGIILLVKHKENMALESGAVALVPGAITMRF